MSGAISCARQWSAACRYDPAGSRPGMVPSLRIAVLAPMLFGIVCAPAQQPKDLHADVERALAKARPALLAHLAAVDSPGVRGGELALVLLAAIHDGVDPADKLVVAAGKRLVKANLGETYDLALRLIVLDAMPSVADRVELARRDARELLGNRASDGGFTYDAEMQRQDLSNTQYAALGLRAAAALGVAIERGVWTRLASAIGDTQGSYGGFDYGRGHTTGADGGYASMTAAGIAVLAICRQQLGAGKHAERLDQRIQRGWQWFERHPQKIGSAQERWSFYFHYGLERAAILCDVTQVGNVDWYEKGARMLLAMQLAGGGWTSDTDGYRGVELDKGRGNGTPTAFAVLFLRRKFQKATPVTPRTATLAGLGPHATAAAVDECTAELVRRGKEALFDVVRALRSEVVPQRRSAAAALQSISGQQFGFDPERDELANRDALRAIELWYLRNR